jgi:hypothetical protein
MQNYREILKIDVNTKITTIKVTTNVNKLNAK